MYMQQSIVKCESGLYNRHCLTTDFLDRSHDSGVVSAEFFTDVFEGHI